MANKKKTDQLNGSETEVLEVESTVIISPVLQEELNKEVARFAPGRAKVADIQKYLELKINGVPDTEGYETVRIAIADCRKLRTTTKADKKVIKAPLYKALEFIENEAIFVECEAQKVEDYLKLQKELIDEEEEKISAEKERIKNARFVTRNQELVKLGAIFDGTNFVLNDVAFGISDIKGLDDDIYNSDVLALYKAEWQKAEDVRVEAKNKKDEEDAAENKKREEFADEQRKFKEQQEEFQKKQKEQQDLLDKQKREKNKARCAQVESIGMTFSYSEKGYVYDKFIILLERDIHDLDDEKWNELIKDLSPEIAQKKKEVEDQRRETEAVAAQARVRKGMLKYFNLIDTSAYTEEALSKLSEPDWLKLHADIRERNTKKEHDDWQAAEDEKKRLAEIENQKKLDESTDSEKWKTILDHLEKTPIVDMKSKKYQAKFNAVRDFLSDMNSI